MQKLFFLTIITLLSICIFSNNTNAQVDIRKEKVYTSVDRMPCFLECGKSLLEKDREECCAEEVRKFMLEYLKYPNNARRSDIQGTVVIRFIVDKDGDVIQPEILSDIGKGCGEEALRVVKLMPRWETPGMQNNERVPVQYDLPVRFSLDDEGRPSGGDVTLSEVVTAAVIIGGFLFAAKKINDNRKEKKKRKKQDRHN